MSDFLYGLAIGFLLGVLISIKTVRDGIVKLLKEWRKKDEGKL